MSNEDTLFPLGIALILLGLVLLLNMCSAGTTVDKESALKRFLTEDIFLEM